MLASALLGESPPTLELRRLLRVAALFGMNENRARVSLSRMAARGEVVADGQGRYALAGHLATRAARLGVARQAATAPFDGTWHLVVVDHGGGDAAARRARRAALRAARLGELRDGTWLRPANLPVTFDRATEAAVSRFAATPEGDPVALATSLFDLAGWARRADALIRELAAARDTTLAEGFVRDAEVLRHLQRDPLLPDALLPDGWPGASLRAAFDEFDARYRARLADAHREAAAAG